MRLPRPLIWLLLTLAFGLVAAWQLRLAWAPPPIPGAPLPLLGGGEQPDWAGTIWTWWWVWEALLSGESPLRAAHNYLPVGQAPLAWYNLVDALFFGPLLRIFGPRVGYNLAGVLALCTTALGATGLCRLAGASLGAAAVAGLWVQLSAFVTTELFQGRVTQAWLLLPLLALGALARLREAPGRRPALLSGLLVALSGYTYWFYGLFLAFAAVPMMGWPRSDPTRARLKAFGLAGLISLLCVAPPALALAAHWADQPGVTAADAGLVAELPLARGQQSLALAITTSHWPLWPLLEAPGDLSDRRLHLGFLGLALLGALLPARLAPSKRAPWLAIAGIGWVLTLGPYLHSWAGLTRIPLPWLLLHDHLPFFSRLWWPERAELLVVAGLSVLGARGLQALVGKLGRWPRGAVLVCVAGALIASRPQALPAAPAAPVDLSLYADLDGKLVTLPIMGDDPHGRKLLWAQAHHGLPILAGLGDHLPGHRPPGYAENINQNEFLRALQQLSVGDQPQTTVRPEAFAALRDQGFTWVVLDRVAFRPGLERQWTAAWSLTLTRALGPPEKQTPGGAAWRIRVPDGPVVLPAIRSVEAGIQNEGLRPIHSRPGPTRP